MAFQITWKTWLIVCLLSGMSWSLMIVFNQYPQNTNHLLRQEADHYFFIRNVWDGVSGLIDVSFLRDANYKKNIDNDLVFKLPVERNLFLNQDKKTVNKLYNDVAALASSAEIYMGLIHQQLVYGRKLVVLLKNEYNLE